MNPNSVVLITGSRKGIGQYLAEHYCRQGWKVIGCSRKPAEISHEAYEHHCLDVSNEAEVKRLFDHIRSNHSRLDALINNAGIASMNHCLLTPTATVRKILETNFVGAFLFCREAAKLMLKNRFGRIINFSTVAVPLKIEGEAAYAASKAAVMSLTQILARELSGYGITVNAVGPTPIQTDLIQAVPREKLDRLIQHQAIPRLGKFEDVANVIDFFVSPRSDFITGQVIYLGGIS